MTDAVTAVHDVFVLAHLGIPRVDGGRSFTQATLEPRRGWARQRFALSWLAAEPGEVLLCVRAIEANGHLATARGRAQRDPHGPRHRGFGHS